MDALKLQQLQLGRLALQPGLLVSLVLSGTHHLHTSCVTVDAFWALT